MASFSQEFLSHSGTAREALAKVSNLDSILATLLATAKEAWPNVSLSQREFLRHMAERLAELPDPKKALASLHAADLYLACAAAKHNKHALAEFERRFLAPVAFHVAKLHPSPSFVDEVKQLVRQRLFVGSGKSRPKILEYSGKGSLSGWLRVTAIRTGLNLRESEKLRDPVDNSGSHLRAPGLDPELDYLKRRYGKEFRQAFQTTLAKLSTKERNLLSLYYLDGMTSGEIASLYRVHGATVRRWLEDARTSILEETHRLLRDRLRLDTSELRGLLDLVRSQLDQSIRRHLK